MKIFGFALALGLLMSCVNVNNSFEGDKVLTTELGTGAQALSQGTCISCHQHAHWADYKTNQEFIDELAADGELVPGNPEESGLFIRVSGGGEGYAVMPPSSGGVDPDVVELFRDWITNMEATPAPPANQ